MSSFDLLFRKYYHSLFRYATKFVDDEEEAHNMVQDVFMVVYEKRIYGQSDLFLKHYLFNAVRNKCLNYIRHRKVSEKYNAKVFAEMKETELEYFDSFEKTVMEKEASMKIHQAIEELPGPQKEVILMSRFEGLRNKEIAEKLDIPVRTVETRIFRALEALRKKLIPNTLILLFHSFFGKKRVRLTAIASD